jgi:hypothetical protein
MEDEYKTEILQYLTVLQDYYSNYHKKYGNEADSVRAIVLTKVLDDIEKNRLKLVIERLRKPEKIS